MPVSPISHISTRQLAQALGVSKTTIRRFVERGMPVLRVGGQFRFNQAAIERWLDPSSSAPSTRCRACGAIDAAEPLDRTQR